MMAQSGVRNKLASCAAAVASAGMLWLAALALEWDINGRVLLTAIGTVTFVLRCRLGMAASFAWSLLSGILLASICVALIQQRNPISRSDLVPAWVGIVGVCLGVLLWVSAELAYRVFRLRNRADLQRQTSNKATQPTREFSPDLAR